MKTYPGITEEIIEPHEHFALFFFIGLMATTSISLVGIYIIRIKTKAKFRYRFNLYVLIVSLLISFLAIKTGSTGGAIRHTEIKEGVYHKAN